MAMGTVQSPVFGTFPQRAKQMVVVCVAAWSHFEACGQAATRGHVEHNEVLVLAAI